MANGVFNNFSFEVNGNTLAFVGTAADDTLNLWVAIQQTSFNYFSVDGADGTDKVSFGTSERNKFKITQNKDGVVHVDSISGASSAVHVTLSNVETLVFANGGDTYPLSGTTKPPVPAAPPAINMGTSKLVLQGMSTALKSLSIIDTDASNLPVQVSLSDDTGLLKVSTAKNLTIVGNGTTHLTLSGTLSTINKALSTLKYTNAALGEDDLSITVTDTGTKLTATATQAVTVAFNASKRGTVKLPYIIADTAPGDKLVFNDANSFRSIPITAADVVASGGAHDSTTLSEWVNAALSPKSGNLAQHQIGWFELNGSTYLIEQSRKAGTPYSSGDSLIQLTGVTLDASTVFLSDHVLTL